MERLTLYAGNGDNYESINPIDTPYEYGKLNLQKIINKLALYEDAEEQGLILKLLCKVGDTVYYKTNNDDIYPIKINEINISNSDITYKGYFMKCTYEFDITDFGKTVFLTKEQAQEALIK